MTDDTSLPTTLDTGRSQVSPLEQLADIPEEEIWLQKQKSPRTRRAYQLDVQHFMRTLGIKTAAELRQADHKAVIAWERFMRETEHAAASTIRRRLAALSSLYKHLVRHDHAARNPVGEVERPAINRDEGSTLAFAKTQARKMLDAPPEDTVAGLRDRAILSVGLQVGLRRAEIAALKVGDLHQNRGYDSLRVMRKGGRRDALAINPQTAARLRAYLDLAGHGADVEGPLFRPRKHNGKRRDERRRMDPDAIDRVVRKYAGELGLDRGYSAHSMRATFITTALENGAQLEDVQIAAGHRDPGTTKLYDRRGTIRRKQRAFLRLIRLEVRQMEGGAGMAERRNVREIKIARMEGRLAEIFSPADVRREIPRIHYASWFLHKHPEHFIQLTPPYHRPALYRLRYPDITCIRHAG